MNNRSNFLKKIEKSDVVFVFFTIFFCAVSYFGSNKMIESNEEIENNKFKTVGMVYDYSSKRSATSISYKYIYNNKKYTSYDVIKPVKGKKYLNNFFEVELSRKNPEVSRIVLEHEIIDTLLINNSGLIIKSKKSNYNMNTNTYE